MKLKTPQLYKELNLESCFTWPEDVHFFVDTLQIVEPKSILETGFFRGGSAFLWLYLSSADITSVDPMINLYDSSAKHDGRIENVEKLRNIFGDRFTFYQKDSKLIRPDIMGKNYDLFFIDGDHWEAGIRNDFQLALDLDIKWILVDDFVTDVLSMYEQEFKRFFMPIRIYLREHIQFLGKPLPMLLLKRIYKSTLRVTLEYDE